LEGHDPEPGTTASVRAVRFTADGGTFINAGDDRRIIHWSVPDWQIKHQRQASAEVFSLALSPDGETLTSGNRDEHITLWSMADGEQIRTLSGGSSLVADGTSLAWLPDGRLVSGGYKGQIRIWDPETGEEQLLPRIHTDQVPAVAVSPDGKRIATGSGGKTIILWGAATSGRLLRQLRGHRNLVLDLTFDPSGQRLLSAGRDNDLRLWDVASGTTLRVFQGHVAGLWSVIVRDGYAYTAANGGTLCRWPLEQSGQWIWDLEDQEPISARPLPDPVGNATGDLLIGFASGAMCGYALPPETSGHSASARLDPESAATADAGDTLVVSSPNAPGDLRLILPNAHGRDVNRFAVPPNGQTLATAGAHKTARS